MGKRIAMPARMCEADLDMGSEGGSGEGPKPILYSHRHNLKSRFELLKTLGEGSYGKVKLAKEKTTGELVAIKYIKKLKINDETEINRIRREIKIMSKLNHPNIINVLEVFENKERIILVLDCGTEGELYDYINKRGKLTEKDARRIFRQIVAAVNYCHQNGVVHRDLKLENIVLDENGNVKIADFGLSNFYSLTNLLSTYCGSPLYASPEIVNGHPYYGPEVDCWSLGVVLYTLVYGAMPFDSSDFNVLRKQISCGDYYEPTEPSEAAGLIRHLLTVNPKKRAKMPDILNHWWVNLGYRETPSGQVYPLPEDSKPVTLRAPTSLSSDSEGENDHAKLVQPLKGILKKPKVSSGDEESVAKQPLQTIALDNQVFDGHDSDKRDTDKKPRSILKRKGKFSGGDSGCVLNETGPKSPSSDTKENAEMTYNLSDIDNALSALETERDSSLSIKRNAAADFVYDNNSQNGTLESGTTTVNVVPRRGILKKTSQADQRKRWSACSVGSNSSADMLDFSYDSGDDSYQFNLPGCLSDSENKLSNIDKLDILDNENELVRSKNQHENGDMGLFPTEEATIVLQQALKICNNV